MTFAMTIDRIHLWRLRMPLRQPHVASHSAQAIKDVTIVQVTCGSQVGYGECVAMADPFYVEEAQRASWWVLTEYLVPLLLGKTIMHPDEVRSHLAVVKGYAMAKSALETAIWDVYSSMQDVSLAHAIGADRTEIEAGIAIGLHPSTTSLLEAVARAVQDGYRRVKLKIKPGYDIEPVQAVRDAHPDLLLMVDANSAYTLSDAAHLRALDAYHLLMIEQPLAYDDIIDHARLQEGLATPICLDESIRSAADGRKAIDIGACRIINIKIGRVGGIAEARDLHDICWSRGIPVWCGGMLETGIGRLANLALAALPGFTIPGDLSPSAHYFAQDLIDPPVAMNRPGHYLVPTSSGIGPSVCLDRIQYYATNEQTFTVSDVQD